MALVMKMYLAQENMVDKSSYEKKLYAWLVLAADSGEEEYAESALVFLCNEEIEKKNFVKAQEYLDRVSERKMLDKRITQANLYIEKGDLESAYVLYESKIYENVNSLFGSLSLLCQLRCREKDYETAFKIADLISIIGEKFSMAKLQRDSARLLIYVEMQRAEETIELLSEMISDISSLTPQKCYLNEHMKMRNGLNQETLRYTMRKILAEKEMDFLREDVRFQQIVETLEK